MSTQTTARGIVGSLRLVGVTAALAAGIAGFGTAAASPAMAAEGAPAAQFQLGDAQQTQVASASGELDLLQMKVPARACDAMAEARVPAAVTVKLGCVYIGDSGPILGIPIIIS